MLERENIDNFIADDLALRNRNWGQIEDELDDRYTKDETDGLLAGKADKQQEEWITPTLLNGWADSSPVHYNTAGYYKDDQGVVRFKGLIGGGNAMTVAFTMPTNYRPLQAGLHLCVNGNQVAIVRIAVTSSTVLIESMQNPSSHISLDNISYRAR